MRRVPLLLLGACSRSISPGDVSISEVVSASSDGEIDSDWIELENLSDRKLDLGGMWLSDAEARPMKHQIPRSTFLEPQGRLLFLADGEPGKGTLHLSFKLSSQGEPVSLSAQSGAPIDRVMVPPLLEGQSYARVAGKMQVCGTPTPSAANECKRPQFRTRD